VIEKLNQIMYDEIVKSSKSLFYIIFLRNHYHGSEDTVMPIYEFYCRDCNTIFNFFSKTINTTKRPDCPKCKTSKLNRQVSLFAVTGKAKEDSGMDDFAFDESKMEKAMQVLAKEADNINEDDPRQAAQLMRKLSNMAGLELGPGMSEALDRMEKGEDPDQLESDIGDMLAGEEPFILPEKKKIAQKVSRLAPQRDETLYDL
jgi:putative FmdB family regulatory protein